MSQTIDVLRSELERLFSLEEMTTVAQLVGLADEVGAHTAKASFARALAERCIDRDAVEALVDVVLQMRREVDPKLRDVGSLLGEPELPAGKPFGPYTIDKKISATEMGVVYLAKKNGAAYMLKTLRREAARDHRAVHRFLTQNRLVATVKHEGLPKNIDAGEIEGTFYVAYENIDAQPLSVRFARTGPSHINELRPILKATLEPLAALHKAQLTHGDLKMDHALVMRGGGRAVGQGRPHRFRRGQAAAAPHADVGAVRPSRGLRVAEDDRARAGARQVGRRSHRRLRVRGDALRAPLRQARVRHR